MKHALAIMVVLLMAGVVSAQGIDPGLDPAGIPRQSGRVVPESAFAPHEAYGIGGQETWLIAPDFTPYFPDQLWRYQGFLYYARETGSGLGPYAAQVELPNGALLDTVCGYFYDNDSTALADVYAVVYRYTYNVSDNSMDALALVVVGTSGAPNYYNACVNLSSPETIQRDVGDLRISYIAYVNLPVSATVQFKAIRLDWHRQISPAPATATFSDVAASHMFFRHIEALASSGITAGCGGGNYCPDSPVTRGEMAAFLAKALGLHWAE